MPDLSHPEWVGCNFSTLSALPVETEIGHGTATAAVAAAPVNGTGIIGIWPGMVAVNSALPTQISCADSVAGIGNVLQRRRDGDQHELRLALLLPAGVRADPARSRARRDPGGVRRQ
jgi:hypothetical protein